MDGVTYSLDADYLRIPYASVRQKWVRTYINLAKKACGSEWTVIVNILT